MIVKQELRKLSLLQDSAVKMGEVEVRDNITLTELADLKNALLKYELVILDDRKSILIEKIKKVVIELIHYEEEPLKINFSDYLSKKLNHEYTYMANLFSEVEGINIEHYLISHKIERVKELLVYDELNITEIAWKMGYSSVAHLSNQFKKITGLTPSFFKKIKEKKRDALEDI